MTRRIILYSVIVLLCVGSLATAQEGRLTGTVRDAQGLVLPGVTITVTGEKLLQERVLTSAADGSYSVAALPAPGEYTAVFEMPGFAMNRVSVGLFNALYYHRLPFGGRERQAPVTQFLYPLDAIEDWNRLYGKRGFYQFQCVLPRDSGERGLPRLLEKIAGSGKASFLAVLKTLGGAGPGHLSFPMKGYTLALDFPRRSEERRVGKEC